ncbi:MAG TPA: hypothetical protein VGG75_38065 [Trebonia sp.]|jgi:hypothetical protein
MDALTELLLAAHAELGPGATARQLAQWMLENYAAAGNGPHAFLPAVTLWVSANGRGSVRRSEKRAFSSAPPAVRGELAAYTNPAEDAMRRLLGETCYVPGQGQVPWGRLTPEHHRLRAAFLRECKRRYVSGADATIARHESAAALLAQAGCPDLDDYADRFGALPDSLLGQDAPVGA